MTGVLLTRPVGTDTRLTELLGAEGIDCVECPLLKIEPLPVSTGLITDLDQFDALIFISVNAVKYGLTALEQYWPQWPTALNWFAVGQATAGALAEWNLKADYPEVAGSEGLLALAPLLEISGKRVLVIRGRGGRELIKETLESRGALVEYLEVYERTPVDVDQQIDVTAVSVVVCTSVEGLEQLIKGLDRREVVKLSLIVPSRRVAQVAEQFGFARVKQAAGASDEAMLNAILDVL